MTLTSYKKYSKPNQKWYALLNGQFMRNQIYLVKKKINKNTPKI